MNTHETTKKKIHVFISYAHYDNMSLTEGRGWISTFHETLEKMLIMKLGKKVSIWRDAKLRGHDVFTDEIKDQFPLTILFVPVLTPRYLESEWCRLEIKEFCKVAAETGGLVIENKSRVFKVIKTPVETQATLPVPDTVLQMLGYEFYTVDSETDKPQELNPAFGKEIEQEFLQTLDFMAYDIASFLKPMLSASFSVEAPDPVEAPALVEAPTPVEARDTVYLAECSYDLKKKRETLAGELKRHGYIVLPEKQMPEIEDDYIAEVDRLLDQCKLSIHLVGTSYGRVPEGLNLKSNVILQNEVAAQRSKAGHLKHRLIWLPEGTSSEQPHQQKFIEAVNREAEVMFGADVITGSIENLKAEIYSTLERLKKEEEDEEKRRRAKAAEKERRDREGAQAGTPEVPEEKRQKMIYLICDEKDRKNIIPMRKFLKGKGFEVNRPLFSGNAETVRAAEKDQLTHCDGVILFYGAGDEGWKYSKTSDLKKMKSYRNGNPMPVNYTYLAQPLTPDKEDLIDYEEPNLIDGLEGFSEAEMGLFLEALNQR